MMKSAKSCCRQRLQSRTGAFMSIMGVEYRSMARALYQNVLAGRFAEEGAPSRSSWQKYVLHLSAVLSAQGQWDFTAYDLERELSKKEILELYVNVINYGDNYIGIKAASEGYFIRSQRIWRWMRQRFWQVFHNLPQIISWVIMNPQPEIGRFRYWMQWFVKIWSMSSRRRQSWSRWKSKRYSWISKHALSA